MKKNKNNSPIDNQYDYSDIASRNSLLMHDLCKECINNCKQYYGKAIPLKLTCSQYKIARITKLKNNEKEVNL